MATAAAAELAAAEAAEESEEALTEEEVRLGGVLAKKCSIPGAVP